MDITEAGLASEVKAGSAVQHQCQHGWLGLMSCLIDLEVRSSCQAGILELVRRFWSTRVLCNTAGAAAVSVLWLTDMASRLQPANLDHIKMRSI